MEEINYRDILDEKHLKALQGFKYSGSDLSFYYNYVGSPLAQYLVDTITPESLAPNIVEFK